MAKSKDEGTIYRTVGRGRPNRPRDVSTVRDLINRVPVPAGGPVKAVAAGDLEGLWQAIENFQMVQLGKVYGYVQPRKRTMNRLNELAREIPETITLNIPVNSRFAQGDARWAFVNLNNLSGDRSILWSKGCALTSIATGFAAKGARLPNPNSIKRMTLSMQAKAQRKSDRRNGRHKHRDWKIADYSQVNPLTLNAWMSLHRSQGFKGRGWMDMSFERVAKVSPSIKYEYRTKQWDKRYPSPAQLRALLDAGLLIIAYRPPHHFVVLRGYRGERTFLVWDVGYTNVKEYDYRKLTAFHVYSYRKPASVGPLLQAVP